MPYLQSYFRHNRGLRDRLDIRAHCSRSYASTLVRPGGGTNSPSPFSVMFEVRPHGVSGTILQNLCHNFILSVPQERACSFNTNLPSNRLEELFIAMPDIETLDLEGVVLSEGFLQPSPDGPYTWMKLLPSLRSLRLGGLILRDDSWGPLVAYLRHQISDVKPISLKIGGFHRSSHVPRGGKEIRDMAEEFCYEAGMAAECPLGHCRGGTASES